jgi:hypothetical protein
LNLRASVAAAQDNALHASHVTIRLLLHRLMALKAALQGDRELQREAAKAPPNNQPVWLAAGG